MTTELPAASLFSCTADSLLPYSSSSTRALLCSLLALAPAHSRDLLGETAPWPWCNALPNSPTDALPRLSVAFTAVWARER
jgi:hypothetical protein